MSHIFVFGSNLAGRHGRGAALYARKHYGAEYGVGEGPTGRAYAIPTKDARLRSLPLDSIARSLRAFARYARGNPDLVFLLTPIGCGLAGYRRDQIRPLVEDACVPQNVLMSEEWGK